MHRLSALALIILACTAQAIPTVIWNTTVGGSGDFLYTLSPASDGGFVSAGTTSLYDANGDFTIVKLSPNGTVQWAFVRRLGGIDALESAQQTSDGGYIGSGYTTSFNNEYGTYLVKLNSSGAEEWNQTSWGASDITWDRVIQAADGGYAAAGQMSPHNSPLITLMLFKFYPNGTMQWNRTFSQNDNNAWGRGIANAQDGGFVVLGGINMPTPGEYGAYLVKTDSAGNPQWNRTYSYGLDTEGYAVVATQDGGYAITGTTWPPDYSYATAWLIKTDPDGSVQWNKTYYAGGVDMLNSVEQTSDGGYLLAGGANNTYAWLLKVDSLGNKQWQLIAGNGSGYTGGQQAVQSQDGSYALMTMTSIFDPNYISWLLKIRDVPGPRANFIIRNSLISTLYLDAISFRGTNVTFPQPIKFDPGERRTVSFDSPVGVCGYKGELVQLQDLTLYYTQGQISGLVQSGIMPLVIRCS